MDEHLPRRSANGVTLQVTGAVTVALPLGLTEHFSFTGVPPGTYTLRGRSQRGRAEYAVQSSTRCRRRSSRHRTAAISWAS
jgi:hypothetical protein